jgi:hypothetical protein
MTRLPLPVALLAITTGINPKYSSEVSEPVYGGYANPRGEIFLFSKDGIAFRVNFKSQTLQKRPPLNPGAQARYDATEAGETFEFGNRTFRRLSHEQIMGICASHRFRVVGIPVRS